MVVELGGRDLLGGATAEFSKGTLVDSVVEWGNRIPGNPGKGWSRVLEQGGGNQSYLAARRLRRWVVDWGENVVEWFGSPAGNPPPGHRAHSRPLGPWSMP